VLHRRLNHWVLAALLVIGQAALLVHQCDIDAHAHGSDCNICLLAHGLNSAVPSQFAPAAIKLDHLRISVAPSSVGARRPTVSYQTRAPPPHPHFS
jgi:hypothetical protein